MLYGVFTVPLSSVLGEQMELQLLMNLERL